MTRMQQSDDPGLRSQTFFSSFCFVVLFFSSSVLVVESRVVLVYAYHNDDE